MAGFNVAWYMKYGSQMCLSMLLNIFSSNSSEFAIMIIHLIQRFVDRSFSNEMETEHDKPNTKKLSQEELNEMYTGP